jgi:hypothetical protein
VGQRIQKIKPIQGALDPLLLRAGGARRWMPGSRQLMAQWNEGPYIFNLGHGIILDTPIAHVEQVLKRVTGKDGPTTSNPGMDFAGRSRIAVVLFNLGGPDGPGLGAALPVQPVQRPGDHRPAGPICARRWRPDLARAREASAQANYAMMGGGSPLLPETRKQARALEPCWPRPGRSRDPRASSPCATGIR